MKIGITGGSGFIGSYLICALREKEPEYELAVATRNQSLCESDRSFRYCDYSEQSFVSAFAGCDVIVHLGSKTSGSIRAEESIMDYIGNMASTENLLKAMRRLNIRRLIATSSCTVYDERKSPFKENMLVAPENCYGISKIAMEMLINQFCKRSATSSVIFRVSQVLGYRDYTQNGFYSMLLKNSIHDQPLILYKGSEQAARDYIYVKDVCGAILMALEESVEGTFNLGMGVPTTNIELATAYQRVFSNSHEIRFVENMASPDTRYWYMGIEKIREQMGWIPQYDLYKMVKDIKAEWESRKPASPP